MSIFKWLLEVLFGAKDKQEQQVIAALKTAKDNPKVVGKRGLIKDPSPGPVAPKVEIQKKSKRTKTPEASGMTVTSYGEAGRIVNFPVIVCSVAIVTTSLQGIDWIKNQEGFNATTGKDQIGVATLGYGHTSWGIPKIDWGMTTTPEEASKWLANDIKDAEDELRPLLKVKAINQSQWDALVSFVFNQGNMIIHGKDILRLINTGGSIDELKKAWLSQYFSEGQAVEDLKNRRALEFKVYSTSTYEYI